MSLFMYFLYYFTVTQTSACEVFCCSLHKQSSLISSPFAVGVLITEDLHSLSQNTQEKEVKSRQNVQEQKDLYMLLKR